MTSSERFPDDTGAKRRTWIVLAAVGAASALWAIFLWYQLVEARSGGTPFCGFADDGDCAALWDAPLANRIHAMTGVPVAGWGVVWGLLAAFLPFLALRRGGGGTLGGATRLVALGGLGGVALLLGVSWAEGMLCTSCVLTYILTGIYAAVALSKAGGRFHSQAFLTAAAGTVVIYVLLLYPGSQTPKNTDSESRKVLAELAAKSAESATSEDGPAEASAGEAPADETGADEAPPSATSGTDGGPITGPVLGTPESLGFKTAKDVEGASGRDLDAELEELIASLPDPLKQGLADSIHFFENQPFRELRPPRAPVGPPDAPVRITEFSDILCKHCASLHENLGYVFDAVPPQSFSYDARQFPLDGHCNAKMKIQDDETVRCVAAKARICLEGSPYAFQYATKLFENREKLDEDMIFELAKEYAFDSPLHECVERPEVKEKLDEDIDYAWEYKLQGTPLVLVNGREAPPFGPFLYAMILTGGKTDHEAFDALPPPTPALPTR